MKTFYFIRHGETSHNAGGLAMGQRDIPLNDLGREQAGQTAAALAAHPIARIVSSDLVRASATAEPLADILGLAVETDPRLRELSFGIFEGRSIAECAREHPEIVAEWRRGTFDYAPPGGETRRSLMERTGAVLRELLDGPHDHVAVVAHGGTLSALHTHIIEDGLAQPREHIHRVFRFSNCSISIAARDDGQWRFLVVNSTTHLDGESRQLLY
jgi:2,3-bisphosphoglycerate-dependent phosphoglycerate mutase